ncbi:uncharacterized protein BDCG_06368 [Blastomyces dermatitidis ER-3]|uniref:RecA family profile 1 domain-containing protein n=1 Tax=Ajellomyces dermatitidis (strain ER-3 / ATCC MYA-2586) TaxID=559297 RepID=A0ABX2VXQ4_AJEDR|nr:uncharacterized protein BDCG_06368 [Blastomyces dermatitidis ER-3]EQL31375.1 hypothetical protein BDFG_06314 [Blastomyces dermatitidis ATCC 26199]OAT01932.1 hypothetical protein BDCG_06368 [Blastomyces dermatitidis ER-3]
MATQEEDIAKFSSPDEARQKKRPKGSFHAFGRVKLPPLSTWEGDGAVSTGLPRLDAALALPSGLRPSPLGPGRNSQRYNGHQDVPAKGIKRGDVTEVTGPRGVGKTSLAGAESYLDRLVSLPGSRAPRLIISGNPELTVTLLPTNYNFTWIYYLTLVDTAGPMNPTRLKDICQRVRVSGLSDNSSDAASNGGRSDEILNELIYFHPPTLAHLLALISHPPKGFPPQETGLIVIDSISSLFTSEYRTKLPPRNSNPKHRTTAESKDERTRWKIIGNLVMDLKKLAARLNCVVIVINEMASRFRGTQPPVLHEALSGITWDSGVTTRIKLCWHWLPPSLRSRVRMKRVRFAEVAKVEKVGLMHGRSLRIVPFVIKKTGLHEFGPRPGGTPLSIFTRISKRPHVVHVRSKRKLDLVIDGSPDTSRKHRMEPATTTPGFKLQNSELDEGTGGTTPSDASLALSIKEEDEQDQGYEYEWLDEEGIEFVDETVDGEEPGSDDHAGSGDGKGDDSPCLSHNMGEDIDDDTVLLLQNISSEDEFD